MCDHNSGYFEYSGHFLCCLQWSDPKTSELSVPLSVNCDPCDSTELLPQPITAGAGAITGPNLQALTLASLPPLSDASCGFRPEEGPFQDTLVPEQPLDLDQAFMASQMSDINISMVSGVQNAPGGQVSNSMIEG